MKTTGKGKNNSGKKVYNMLDFKYYVKYENN